MRLLVLPLFLAALAGAVPSAAGDYAIRGLRIGHPWARPVAAGLNGAAYFQITNTNKTDDVLKSVEVASAKKAMIHRSAVASGVSSMRALAAGLPIPAGATVRLAPGGDHVMLVGLNKAFVQGTRVPATLVFQRAGRVQVELAIENEPGAAATAPAAHDHH